MLKLVNYLLKQWIKEIILMKNGLMVMVILQKEKKFLDKIEKYVAEIKKVLGNE